MSMRPQGIGISIQYAKGSEYRGDGAEEVSEDETMTDVDKDRDHHSMGEEGHQVGQIVVVHLRDPKWIPTYLLAETVAEARDGVAAQDPHPALPDTQRHHLRALIGVENMRTTEGKGDTIAPDLHPVLRPVGLMIEGGRLVLVKPTTERCRLIHIRLGHVLEQGDGKDPQVARQEVQLHLRERAIVIEDDTLSLDLEQGLGVITVTTDTKIGPRGIVLCPLVLTMKGATEGLML